MMWLTNQVDSLAYWESVVPNCLTGLMDWTNEPLAKHLAQNSTQNYNNR